MGVKIEQEVVVYIEYLDMMVVVVCYVYMVVWIYCQVMGVI